MRVVVRVVAHEARLVVRVVVVVVGIGRVYGSRAGRIGRHPEGGGNADVGAFAGEVEVVVVFVWRGGREWVRGWEGV